MKIGIASKVYARTVLIVFVRVIEVASAQFISLTERANDCKEKSLIIEGTLPFL